MSRKTKRAALPPQHQMAYYRAMRSVTAIVFALALATGACGAATVQNSGKPAEKGVSGTIVASQEMASRIAKGGVVFLEVRRVEANGKPNPVPLATVKLKAAGWPIGFSLTAVKNPLRGKVELTAWYDQDGDAKTKQSGDILGKVLATAPAQGVELELNQMGRR